MKAEHKIKREILRRAERYSPDEFSFGDLESAEAIDEAWIKLDETGLRHEHEAEVRGGQCETDIPAPWSRHYESKSVAAKLEDGSWVGWTYWYGGGKHGEPQAVDWIEYAYNLECKEEERLVVVRTFTVADQPDPPAEPG